MNKAKNQAGSAHAFLAIAIVVAIAGGVGFVGFNAWQNQSSNAGNESTVGRATTDNKLLVQTSSNEGELQLIGVRSNGSVSTKKTIAKTKSNKNEILFNSKYSPDKTSIAWMQFKNDSTKIVISNNNGKVFRSIKLPKTLQSQNSFHWTGDSKTIVFSASKRVGSKINNQVMSVNIAGSPKFRVLYSQPIDFYKNKVAYTTLGSKLAVIKIGKELYRTNVSNNKKMKLISTSVCRNARDIENVPTSNEISYVCDSGNRKSSTLYKMDVNGKKTKVYTYSTTSESMTRYTPATRIIDYSWDVTGKKLAVQTISSKESKKNCYGNKYYSYSAENKVVIIENDSVSEIYSSGNLKPVCTGARGASIDDVRSISWNPSSTNIAFVKYTGASTTLHVLNVASKKIANVANGFTQISW